MGQQVLKTYLYKTRVRTNGYPETKIMSSKKSNSGQKNCKSCNAQYIEGGKKDLNKGATKHENTVTRKDDQKYAFTVKS